MELVLGELGDSGPARSRGPFVAGGQALLVPRVYLAAFVMAAGLLRRRRDVG